MAKSFILSILLVCAATFAQAASLKSLIDEEHLKCESGEDTMACIKERAMRLVDTILNKDNYRFADVEVRANGYQAAPKSVDVARTNSDDDFFAGIENYLQGHDLTMNLPMADAKVTISARNLDNDEMSVHLKLADGVVEGKGKKGNFFKKGRKNRLRKMAMPIMVLILLKAITVIPMAIGILKIKAFNALALGFFSFIVSVGLAIFQLCKKLAQEHHHTAHITAHGPWDGRSLNINAAAAAAVAAPSMKQFAQIDSAQELAYQAYA